MKITLAAVTVAVAVAASTNAGAAPCFPEVDGMRIDRWLQRLRVPNLENGYPLPGKRTRGACTVDGGRVREHDGTLVALLGCGTTIRVAGISDDHGVEVGTRAERVLDAYGDGPSSRLVCVAGTSTSRRRTFCWIPVRGVEPPSYGRWGYAVWGRPPADAIDEDGMTRGEDALAFFRTRTILEMVDRGSCH